MISVTALLITYTCATSAKQTSHLSGSVGNANEKRITVLTDYCWEHNQFNCHCDCDCEEVSTAS